MGNEIVRSFLGVLLGVIFVSMLADTIDVQELNTGRRQEGIFAAALAFSGKATAGVGAIAAGFLLQQLVRWPAERGRSTRTVGAGVVTRLGLVAGILVPVLLIIPFWLGTRYRITRASHQLTREELERRRAAAHLPPGEEPSDSARRWRPSPVIPG